MILLDKFKDVESISNQDLKDVLILMFQDRVKARKEALDARAAPCPVLNAINDILEDYRSNTEYDRQKSDQIQEVLGICESIEEALVNSD